MQRKNEETKKCKGSKERKGSSKNEKDLKNEKQQEEMRQMCVKTGDRDTIMLDVVPRETAESRGRSRKAECADDGMQVM